MANKTITEIFEGLTEQLLSIKQTSLYAMDAAVGNIQTFLSIDSLEGFVGANIGNIDVGTKFYVHNLPDGVTSHIYVWTGNELQSC